MRLRDLDAVLVRSDGPLMYRNVGTLAEAQGVLFLCPLCRARLGTDVGCHSVLVWFDVPGLDPAWEPTPRWKVSGTSLDDLTLDPSVNVPGDWHGWVRDGDAT